MQITNQFMLHPNAVQYGKTTSKAEENQWQAKLVNPAVVSKYHAEQYTNLPKLINKGLNQHHISDYELQALSAVSSVLTVLGIATVNGWSRQMAAVSRLPFWVGAASWLTAMSVYPKIIQQGVQLKTGVPQNVYYRSSEDQLRYLYNDPNYMPTQILPQTLVQKLCQRYHIPYRSQYREERLQSKLRQVSSQAYTWTMLTAGAATPLLAAMFSDALESPARYALFQGLGRHFNQRTLDTAVAMVNRERHKIITTPSNKVKLTQGFVEDLERIAHKSAEKLVDISVGENSYSQMSQWWQKFSKEIVEHIGLASPKELQYLADPKAHPAQHFERLIGALYKNLDSLQTRERVESYLRKQIAHIEDIVSPLIEGPNAVLRSQGLKNCYGTRHEAARKALIQEVRLARGRSVSTVDHFMNVIEQFEANKALHPKNPELRKELLRQSLEKPKLAYFEKLLSEGQLEKAKQLLDTTLSPNGNRYFELVMNRMKSGQFQTASQLFGETPKELLLRSVRSMGRRQDWVRFMPKGLGIGLLVSGLAYIGLAVGKANKFLDDMGDTVAR